MSHQKGWIGVDLDGCLAQYDGWKGIEHIGDPVPEMLEKVLQWLENDKLVKIVTARVWAGDSGEPTGDRFRDAQQARQIIEKWCIKHIGIPLPVTCCKDFSMIALYDDRCIQVRPNTGEILGDESLIPGV